MKQEPIVRYSDASPRIPCPYGDVRRVVSGGEGSGNVHIVRVQKGDAHFHQAYDEVYYFLSGSGTIVLDGRPAPVKPGAVVFIPAGTVHSLESSSKAPLEFIIFGTPPMSIEDEKARPEKP